MYEAKKAGRAQTFYKGEKHGVKEQVRGAEEGKRRVRTRSSDKTGKARSKPAKEEGEVSEAPVRVQGDGGAKPAGVGKTGTLRTDPTTFVTQAPDSARIIVGDAAFEKTKLTYNLESQEFKDHIRAMSIHIIIIPLISNKFYI